jgi:hypothetical protein
MIDVTPAIVAPELGCTITVPLLVTIVPAGDPLGESLNITVPPSFTIIVPVGESAHSAMLVVGRPERKGDTKKKKIYL